MKRGRNKSAKNKRRKNAGRIAAAVFGLSLAMGMTGCVKTTEKQAPEESATQESEWEKEEPVTAKEAKPEPEKEEPTDNVEEPEKEEQADNAEEPEKEEQADNVEEPEKEEQADSGEYRLSRSEGTEYLGGKVQNPQADGMTLAQTTLVDENGSVTLLDVKNAKKISVKFTPDTKVEHWTIQGGGAGIDMQDAAVSDLEEGMSVEVEGYYEKETFVAVKVIVEEYV